jgi:ATP-binding cassette subfamily B protein
MLSRLLRDFLRNSRPALIAVLVFQTAQAVATLLLPGITADIINKGVLLKDNDYIWRHGGLMLAVSFVQVICAVAAVYYGSRAAMALGRDVRAGLFHKVTGFSAQEVGHFGAPSLITRITNDVQQVQMVVLMSCTLLLAAPITIIGGTILAIREDGPLSWELVVSIPVLVIAVGLVVSRMVPQFRLMQDRIDDVNKVLREQITGIRVVRAFVREPAEVERFDGSNSELTDTSLNAGRLMALMFPIVLLVLNGSSIAVLWFGGHRIDSGAMSVGALIAFLSYLTQILLAVMMATFMVVLIPRAAVCAERIMEVLDTESSVVTSANAVTEVHESGLLELRDVGFHYPGAESPVLSDVSFTARPGQTTAIIGSTGAGKTTLLNLVPRLFDATGGSVVVDGVDVRDLDPDTLWRRIGLVPQKPYLFSGTVASNLRHGNPNATDDQMWAALEVAQATKFVQAMPGQLNEPIVQGGANVSGGQRQRLAIARALIREPEIYLFDDSFSALDLATDARLRAAMAPLVAQRTVIIVAQRVSTIINADQILVLEDGVSMGLGSHAELLETCPTYVEIVESQMSAQDAA